MRSKLADHGAVVSVTAEPDPFEGDLPANFGVLLGAGLPTGPAHDPN